MFIRAYAYIYFGRTRLFRFMFSILSRANYPVAVRGYARVPNSERVGMCFLTHFQSRDSPQVSIDVRRRIDILALATIRFFAQVVDKNDAVDGTTIEFPLTDLKRASIESMRSAYSSKPERSAIA